MPGSRPSFALRSFLKATRRAWLTRRSYPGPTASGEGGVPLLRLVAAVLRKQSPEIKAEAVLLPLVLPAREHRALGVHEQTVKIEHHGLDRHPVSMPSALRGRIGVKRRAPVPAPTGAGTGAR